MSRLELEQTAREIVRLMEEGWTEAGWRMYERAIERGASFEELEDAIFTVRYGR